MKYYLVYLLNYKESDSITIKDLYHNKEDAINSLERNATEFIKELQGKQQSDICKQERSIDEILNDTKLREGLYFKKEGDAIIIYEKATIVKVGTVWNSSSIKVQKFGKIYVTEYNFDDALFRSVNIPTTNPPKTVRPTGNWGFLDELKGLDGKFNLKPAKGRGKKIVTKTSFNNLCLDIDNGFLH